MLFVSTVLIFYFNKKETEQALCYVTMALALWRQGDRELQDTLGYVTVSCLNIRKYKRELERWLSG